VCQNCREKKGTIVTEVKAEEEGGMMESRNPGWMSRYQQTEVAPGIYNSEQSGLGTLNCAYCKVGSLQMRLCLPCAAFLGLRKLYHHGF
jgi:hypothetical protein